MPFSIGEKVEWTSQSQGRSKRKYGVVAAYVPPGERPSKDQFPDLYRGVGCGYGRDTESYVVKVGASHYWPIAKNLRLSNRCPACDGTGVKA